MKRGHRGSVVRIGRIEYLNVAPVYYGFDHGLSMDGLTWVYGPPAALNRMMEAGEIDIGPVSSAAYADFQNDWLILPDLSISCCGPVMSVILVSRYPLEQLDGRRIALTDESASGAALLKLLADKQNVRPDYRVRRVVSPELLADEVDAALIIGDTALKKDWKAAFPFVWDLGHMWHQQTALPFVFALWTVRKAFAERHPAVVSSVCRRLETSRDQGLGALDDICRQSAERTGFSTRFLKTYFHQLSYNLDESRQAGLKRFFDELFARKIINAPVALSFFRY